MAEVTVSQLAETVGTPAEKLLQQMKDAGMPHTAEEDLVSEEQKQELLTFLKKSHGEDEGAPRKITLKRRTLSTLKTTGGAGRGRTVNVEVRKKRTYVRRTPVEDQPEEEIAAAPAAEAQAPLREISEVAEQEAVRRSAQAEAEAEAERKRQEAVKKAAELAEQKAREKEEAEKKRQEEAKKAEEAKKVLEQQTEELEESKVSSRKDKRDRHDLDEEDPGKAKKNRQGRRKKIGRAHV